MNHAILGEDVRLHDVGVVDHRRAAHHRDLGLRAFHRLGALAGEPERAKRLARAEEKAFSLPVHYWKHSALIILVLLMGMTFPS